MLKKWFGCLSIVYMLSVLHCCSGSNDGSTAQLISQNEIDIKRGGIPVIDGLFSPGEWSDANSIHISIDQDWRVQVLYKHADSCLYIAFSNLIRNGKNLYPELLVDVKNDKTATWDSDDWWFHVSYSDCEGNSKYNSYSDKGSCKRDHTDWTANNFPLNPPGIIEIKIPYAKVGLAPSKSKAVGMAFDVTDTRSKWYFWPAGAKLEKPSTWAIAISSDGWQ